jgi:hypothetical protein
MDNKAYSGIGGPTSSVLTAEIIDSIDHDDEHWDEIVQRANVRPNMLRLKINEFLATKEMTQTKFLSEIGGVNPNSFRNFMALKGNSGLDNRTYWGGVRFFIKRGEFGGKGSKRKLINVIADESENSTDIRKKTKISDNGIDIERKLAAHALPEGEPILDTCDEVRAKLFEFMRDTALPKTSILKHLDLTAPSLNKFFSCKGPKAGAGQKAYPSAYRFFETLRIADAQPKSATRLKNEQANPRGFDMRNEPTHMWVLKH